MNIDEILRIRNGVGEIKSLSDGNGKVWERGVLTESVRGAVTALTNTRKVLPNTALTPAKVMPSVKIFGKTTKSIVIGDKRYIVPDEYDVVEYIETNGNAYIDTGYTGGSKTRAIIKAQHNSVSNVGALFGARTSVARNAFLIQRYNFRIDYGTSNLSGMTQPIGTPVVLEKNRERNYIDGVEVSANPVQEFDCEYPFYLLAANNAGSVAEFNGRCYYCTIWDDDILVRDFVPVKKRSNNEYGMYDLVTKQFFGNAGTGEFIAGGKLPVELYGVGDKTANLFDIDNTTSAYLNAEGVAVGNINYACSDFIEIKPNTSYTFSGETTSAVSTNGQRICFYDSSKTFISPRRGGTYTSTGKWSFTETAPSNAKYIRISCGYSINIQLEEGSTAPTEYIPYGYQVDALLDDDTKHTFYTDKQLKAVSTYEDVLTSNNDGTGSITRNVGVRAYQTGDEDDDTVITDMTNTYYPLATPVTTQLTGLPIIELTEKAEHTLENTNLVKGDIQVEYLGIEGSPQTFLTSNNDNFLTSDNKQLKTQL